MEQITYTVIPSDRKTVAIQISREGILVRTPRSMDERSIQRFVESKVRWIGKHLAKHTLQPQLPVFTREELDSLSRQAAQTIPQRAAHFAALLGVSYSRITIRCQRTRWGSCSSKGNLNFNCLLILAPPEVLDYVVVHELCHRKELNHSARFWALVEGLLPDYKTRKLWLKENGSALIRRLPD